MILFTAHDEDCLRDNRALLAAACVEKADNLAELKRVVAHTLKRQSADDGNSPLRMGLPPAKMEMECP